MRTNTKQPWIAVPVSEVGGIDCAALSSTRSPWVVKLLTSGCNKKRDAQEVSWALKAFERQVRESHRTAGKDVVGVEDIDNGLQPAGTQRLAASEAVQPFAKKRRLTLDSDDEEDTQLSLDSHSSIDSNDRRTTNRKKCQSIVKVGLSCITFGDTTMMVGINKGPGILIQASEDNLLKTITHLSDNFSELAQEGRKMCTQRAELVTSGPNGLQPGGLQPGKDEQLSPVKLKQLLTDDTKKEDIGKVRYDFNTGGFIIQYEGDDGKRHRISAGFLVPRIDMMGNNLDIDAYAKVKTRTQTRARAKWNEMDKSKVSRFPACSQI